MQWRPVVAVNSLAQVLAAVNWSKSVSVDELKHADRPARGCCARRCARVKRVPASTLGLTS